MRFFFLALNLPHIWLTIFIRIDERLADDAEGGDACYAEIGAYKIVYRLVIDTAREIQLYQQSSYV